MYNYTCNNLSSVKTILFLNQKIILLNPSLFYLMRKWKYFLSFLGYVLSYLTIGFDVAKTGDARIGFVGFPSVGKSTLLSNLAGVYSEVAAYEFTTLTTVPGYFVKFFQINIHKI